MIQYTQHILPHAIGTLSGQKLPQWCNPADGEYFRKAEGDLTRVPLDALERHLAMLDRSDHSEPWGMLIDKRRQEVLAAIEAIQRKTEGNGQKE